MANSKIASTIFVLIIFLNVGIKIASAQDSIPDDFCITEKEVALYNLINNYRKSVGLNEIPLSKSLSYVAKTHTLDLDINKPDTNTCNFHSWSSKGKWTPCCFEKEIKDKSCMLNKPTELTKYPGPAYEIVYWENKQASAEKAFKQWKETSASRAVLSNYKDWENYSWNAMGVWIHKGFAIAWFGESEDVERETKVCGSNETIKNAPQILEAENQVITAPTGRFYVIVGSFNSLKDAKENLKVYQAEGFKKAKVVVKEKKHRISLSDYSSQELASKAKKQLPSKYKDAWILAY